MLSLRCTASSLVKSILIHCSMVITSSCFCISYGYNPYQAVFTSLLMCCLLFWIIVTYVFCLPSTQDIVVHAQRLHGEKDRKETVSECRSSMLKQRQMGPARLQKAAGREA